MGDDMGQAQGGKAGVFARKAWGRELQAASTEELWRGSDASECS